MARVFEQGLGKPRAMCCRCAGFRPGRASRAGPASRGFSPPQLFLVPGDSPMGYRLPLDSLPWTKPEDVEWTFEADPFRAARRTSAAPDAQAASFHAGRRLRMSRSRGRNTVTAARKGESAQVDFAPALCVQPRGGRLFVFMPPVEFLADYLDLIAAIEDTAAHLKMPVTIEGYAPPPDPRLGILKVTPDPGVIEVNIQPAGSWDELVRNTTDLYELAHQCRLGTEKFMIDGQHAGTGGGNHVVVGAAVPEDSPFLRRPDLLRSMIGFWQNHPSLSYLFSGLFIGPTSQHPRIDEARLDSLYEMQIAFNQVPDPGTEESRRGWWTASSAIC